MCTNDLWNDKGNCFRPAHKMFSTIVFFIVADTPAEASLYNVLLVLPLTFTLP